VARTLPVLWRHRILHRDMAKLWINRQEFLMAQSGDAEDRAVIVTTPDTIGIALFAEGQGIAAYTTAARTPSRDLVAVQTLMDIPEGTVTVLERFPGDLGEPYITKPPEEA